MTISPPRIVALGAAWLLLGAQSGLPDDLPKQDTAPVRLCTAADDVASNQGQVRAVIGRFSFRENGRFLSEVDCDRPEGEARAGAALEVAYDEKSGPMPPPSFSLDRAKISTQLAALKRKTRLRQFRFGSSEYDRWAIVYGRLELRPSDQAHSEFGTITGRLVSRSEAMVIFLPDSQ